MKIIEKIAFTYVVAVDEKSTNSTFPTLLICRQNLPYEQPIKILTGVFLSTNQHVEYQSTIIISHISDEYNNKNEDIIHGTKKTHSSFKLNNNETYSEVSELNIPAIKIDKEGLYKVKHILNKTNEKNEKNEIDTFECYFYVLLSK